MILLISACSKESEATQIIPFWAGFRIENDTICSWEEVSQNIATASQESMQGCVIECILDKNAHFTLPDYWPQMLEAFRADSLQYGLSFKLAETAIKEKKDSIRTAILAVLRHSSEYEPQFIALSGNLAKVNFMGEQMDSISVTVRQHAIPLMLAASYAQLSEESFRWDLADQIGLVYLPFVEEDFPKYFKKINSEISNLLIKNNKEIFILESNILGNRKYELLNNELKFWHDSTSLKGLNFNTLYCKCPLRDSSSYYRLDF